MYSTVTLLGFAPIHASVSLTFTKDNERLCMVATYYVGASGFIAGLALLILLAVSITTFRKASKSHNVVLRNKLMELNNIFNIDSKRAKEKLACKTGCS